MGSLVGRELSRLSYKMVDYPRRALDSKADLGQESFSATVREGILEFEYQQKPLTDVELAEAKELAKAATPDTYTLRRLYGGKWFSKEPHGFGMRFKESVRRELIPGVKYYKDTGSHSAQYHVRRA